MTLLMAVLIFFAGVSSGWCIMSLLDGSYSAALWFFISAVSFAVGAVLT